MKLIKSEFKYSLRELLRRAGLNGAVNEINGGFECHGIRFYYCEILRQTDHYPTVIFMKSSPQDWNQLINLQTPEIRWVGKKQLLPPGHEKRVYPKTPILFWGKNIKSKGKPINILSEKTVVFNADFIAAVLFMLSRWEETVLETRDKHDRFPAQASLAYRNGFLDRPIVDEYAFILRSWIQYLLPGWNPQIKSPSLLLTHDIDFIRKYSHPIKLGTTLYHQFENRSNLNEILSSVRFFFQEIRHPSSSVYIKGISKLAEISRRNEIKSIFFFQATDPSKYDSGYSINDPQIQTEIQRIKEYGFEIGLHPSYDSYNNYQKLAVEKQNLEKQLSREVKFIRQHYLRFKVPLTWQIQSQADFTTDFSLGYPEMGGFRCGTCHSFHPYDLTNKKEMKILETPLIVMDRTLMNYRKMKPKQAFDRISEILKRCLEVEGVFSLLWHNSSLMDEYKEWGDMYQSFTENLTIT
jgi:hypothetical protein